MNFKIFGFPGFEVRICNLDEFVILLGHKLNKGEILDSS